MDIKKTSVNDIYQSIQKGQDIQELYKKLSEALGDNNPFAKFSIGSGFYVWSHPSGQWQCLADAEGIEQEMVNSAIVELHKQVAKKVGEKTADAIFTVPDESYIFYNNDGSGVKLLYTGWGFKKPVRTIGRPDIDSVEKRIPVDICFSFDGERLPDYEFGIQLPKQLKQLKTNEEGLYHFNNLKVGENYLFKDLKSGRDFTLVVEEGKSLYEFDVTTYTNIEVKATIDGQPLADEPLTIDYNGQTISLTTGEMGTIGTQVTLRPGEPFTATMRDNTQSGVLEPEGNLVTFEFESEKPPLPPIIEEEEPTPPPPPPTFLMPHILIVGDQGYIGTRYPISVEYHGTVTNYVSDDNGFVYLPQMENGQQMRVNDGLNPDNIADYTLNCNQDEYIFHVPYVPNNEARDIKVMVRDKDNKPIRCNHIRFQQPLPDGTYIERLMQLDAEGNTYFAKTSFQVGPEIVTTFIGSEKEYEPIKFTLEENENEYLLQEKGEGGWWYIILEILAVLAVAGGAYFAWPSIVDAFRYLGQML